MTNFCTMVKKQEEIESLKKENKELNQALNEILSELKERGGFDIFIKGIEKTLNKYLNLI